MQSGGVCFKEKINKINEIFSPFWPGGSETEPEGFQSRTQTVFSALICVAN